MTDDHRKEMVRHIQLLEDYYRGQKVYVSGDLLVYYVQGDPRKYVLPDAFVVKGIVPGNRRTYKIWVEGRVPDVVIETTSRNSWTISWRTVSCHAAIGVVQSSVVDAVGLFFQSRRWPSRNVILP